MMRQEEYISTWTKTLAYARKDFLTDTSYTFSFFSRWVGIFFSVIMFYYLSRLLNAKGSGYLSEYGSDYFSFVLVGLALMSLCEAGMNGFCGSVMREQASGTLEVLMSSPTPLKTLICAFSLYNLLMGLLALLFYLCLGAVFGVDFSYIHWPAVVLAAILTVTIFWSLGTIAASCLMVFKRGDPVTWLVGTFFWIFGGLYFPITVFPEGLQKISFCLPTTYSLKVFRLAFFQGHSIAVLKDDFIVLGIFAIVLGVIGLWMFQMAFRFVKEKGTISFY